MVNANSKFIGFLLLAVAVAYTPVHASDASVNTKLQQILETTQTSARKVYRELAKTLRQDQAVNGSISYPVLKVQTYSLISVLHQFKFQMEMAADEVSIADLSAAEYWDIINQEYYEYLGQLFKIKELYSKKIGLKTSEIEALYIRLPHKSVTVLQGLIRDVAAGKSLTSFNEYLFFEPDPTEPLLYQRLVFAPDAVLQKYASALMAHPTKESAKQVMTQEAVKILLAERASLLNFMHPEEQINREIPEDAPEWVQTKWEHALAAGRESLIRESMTLDWVQPITNHARKVIREKYRQKAKDSSNTAGASFFNDLATRYAEKLSPVRLNALIGDADHVRSIKENGLSIEDAEKISKTFVDTYFSQNYRSFFWRALNAAPHHLATLSASDMEKLLEETARNVHYAILSDFVFSVFFERSDCKAGPQRCLSAAELAAVQFELASWAEDLHVSFRDSHIVNFFAKTRNIERIIAIRRYAIADDFITAALAYAATESILKELERQEDSVPVPVSLLPENPDLRYVLPIALEGVPDWISGLISSFTQGIDDVKKQSERNKRKTRLWLTLDRVDELLKTIQETSRNADAISAIKDADQRLRKYKPYAWHSTRLKMSEIYRILDETQAPTSQALLCMRAVVQLQNLLQGIFSQTAIAVTEQYIGPILSDLVSGKRTGTKKVSEIFAGGREYLRRHNDLLFTIFGPANLRKQEFRALLKSKKNYKKYLENVRQNGTDGVRDEYPGLFLPIPYPGKIDGIDLWKTVSRPSKPLTLYDFIRRLAPTFCSMADQKGCSMGAFYETAGPALGWVEALTKRSKKAKFDTVFETPVGVADLLPVIANETSFETEEPTIRSRLGIASKLDEPVSGSSDEFFSKGLHARDFYGAQYHKAVPLAKALRVYVSNILSAYFKSAEQANYKNLQKVIKGEKIRFLVMSGAFYAAKRTFGDEAGRLFEKIKDEEFESERFWQNVQSQVHNAGGVAHILFVVQAFWKHPLLHAVTAFYFGGSAITNVSIDGMTFLRTYDDLSMIDSYTQSALLDRSLADTQELQNLRAQAEALADGLFDTQRLGWDIIMFLNSTGGLRAYLLERRLTSKSLAALELRRSDIPKKDPEKAYEVLKGAYQKRSDQIAGGFKYFRSLEHGPEKQRALERIRRDYKELGDHYLYMVSTVAHNFHLWSERGSADVKEVSDAAKTLGIKLTQIDGNRKNAMDAIDTAVRTRTDQIMRQSQRILDSAKDVTQEFYDKVNYGNYKKFRKLRQAEYILRSYIEQGYVWSKGGKQRLQENDPQATFEEYVNSFKKPGKEVDAEHLERAHVELGLDYRVLERMTDLSEVLALVKKAKHRRAREVHPDFLQGRVDKALTDWKSEFSKLMKREPTTTETEDRKRELIDTVTLTMKEEVGRVNAAAEVLEGYYKQKLGKPDSSSETPSRKPEPPKGPLLLPPGDGK